MKRVIRCFGVILCLAMLFLLVPTAFPSSGTPAGNAGVLRYADAGTAQDSADEGELIDLDDMAVPAGSALERVGNPDSGDEDGIVHPDTPMIGSKAEISATKIVIPLENGAEGIGCEVVFGKNKDLSDGVKRHFRSYRGYVKIRNLEPDTTYYFSLRYFKKTDNGKKVFSYFARTAVYTTNPGDLTITDKNVEVKFGKTKKIKAKADGLAAYTINWSSDDEFIATVDKDGNVKGVHAGSTKIRAAIPELGIEKTVKLHVKGLARVALTFDDGPGSYTEGLLDFLKDKPVKVTFFLIGQQVKSYSKIVKRMLKEGHEVGNHSYTHAQLTKLSKDGIKNELEKTRKAIHDATGSYPTVMRPPYGSKNDTVLSVLDVPCIIWNIDTLDWKYRDADRNVQQLLGGAKDGNIILMHDVHKTSVEGAKRAIPQLLDKGIEFVTVTELITTEDGSNPKAGKAYYNAP
ncbi:MAG: polysaccharide deacetylase family protein [Lachnospiraceae bacterium]|nr:polysaccharide deacetylase family protein [Lachnospiraceae bacterium]